MEIIAFIVSVVALMIVGSIAIELRNIKLQIWEMRDKLHLIRRDQLEANMNLSPQLEEPDRFSISIGNKKLLEIETTKRD